MVYYMSQNNEVEKMYSNIFKDQVQMRMPSLSIFTYSESTHFSEFFDISYIMVRVLQAKKPFNTAWMKTQK